MAPVKYTKAPDLSGRTPLYRLSKTAPSPQPQPTPTQSSPSQLVNNAAQPYQPPYHPSPYHSPYPLSQAQPHPQPTPQNNKENALSQIPQHSLSTDARGSPMTKRRGRKLQENETLTLINCCLEYQSIYHDNPSKFWYCIHTSLKRQIKRNFSWQSCRQIVEELVAERRERRRDVAAGKIKEQPLTELVVATDKWILFSDAVTEAPSIATPAHSLKRAGQPDTRAPDSNAVKKPKQVDHTTPSMPAPPLPPMSLPMPAHPMPPVPIPTIPSGPTMSEFQTLKVDIQSLRMDVQGLRREMHDFRHEVTAKLDLILQSLQGSKARNESNEK